LPGFFVGLKARYFIVETRVGTGGGETRARLAICRRSTRGSAVRVDRRRLDRLRLAKADFSFSLDPSGVAIVATCRLFRVDRF